MTSATDFRRNDLFGRCCRIDWPPFDGYLETEMFEPARQIAPCALRVRRSK